MGLPRYPHHLCDVPCPLPRRTGWRLSTPSSIRAAFPDPWAGRHPQLHFRGLLRLHSRYGPPHRSTALGGLCHEASTRQFSSHAARQLPVYRLLSGWNPPPQVIRAFVAHQGCSRSNDHEVRDLVGLRRSLASIFSVAQGRSVGVGRHRSNARRCGLSPDGLDPPAGRRDQHARDDLRCEQR